MARLLKRKARCDPAAGGPAEAYASNLQRAEWQHTKMASDERIPFGSAPVEGLAVPAAPGRALEELEDRVLIERAQAGDRPAFETLVHRYDRDVLRLALNVLHSPEDARDVYQESFLKIYRNLHRFRVESSFYTWVYRIVTNACLDHLRRRRSRPEDQAPEWISPSREEGSAGDFFEHQQEKNMQANPERQVLGEEIGQQIEAALQTLSPRERVVFELKHYHGLKLRAIGEALGTTEETVKNSLFRATRKLRVRLEGLR
jgi:RNA polymerase sigma-70 factor, ECF subfamily